MSISHPFAVFGVSGRTGSAAAKTLLRSGKPVRVILRDPSKGQEWADRGAEIAVADLMDAEATTRALENVQGAYVVSPPNYAREDLFERAAAIADVAAQAAAAAAVPKIVALSSVGADRPSGTGWIAMNRMLEDRFTKSGVPTTFLRAVYFMENWAPLVGEAVRNGVLPSFLTPADRTLDMVATVDIGEAAATFLQEEWNGMRAVGITGPAPYSPQDVARIIASTVGRPITVAALPETAWSAAPPAASFSKAGLAGFTEMTRSLNSGHIDLGSDPNAPRWSCPTPLEKVIAELTRRAA